MSDAPDTAGRRGRRRIVEPAPKPQRSVARKAKERPASKGRVHKGKTRS